MKKILLETERTGYTPAQCGRTLTVGELMTMLESYDEDTEVYFSNDDGYTYGSLTWDTIRDYEEEDEDEDI